MRRPLIGLVLLFTAGTWLGLVASARPLVLTGAALLLLAGAWLVRRFSGARRFQADRIATAAILAAAALAGWANASARSEAAATPTWLTDETIVLEGRIQADPVARDALNRDWSVHDVDFAVEAWRPAGGEAAPAGGSVRLRWHHPDWGLAPAYGQRWRLREVRIRPVDSPAHSAGFAMVFPRQAEFLGDAPASQLKATLYRLRRGAAARLRLGIEDYPRQSGLLQALLLGYRSELPREIRELGAATGTLHIFAISGLHVGIVAGLAIFVLRAFGVSRVHWFLLLAPCLIAYTIMTGARASAVRACIMACIYFLAPALGRRSDVASALALAAALILAVAPDQLAELGFIFSFVVVIGIVALYPLFASLLLKATAPDPLRLEAPGRWRSLRRAGRNYLAQLVGISAAAWIASMPLTALFFERFTPIALVGNLFVIPLAFLIVISGCLSLLAGSVADIFGEIFNHAALAVITIFIEVIRLLSVLPFATVEVPGLAMWRLVLWYALWALLAVALRERLPAEDATDMV